MREVAAVKDEFIGEGRRGVLLRQPRLGAVTEISGCLGGCEDAAHWSRIYPEPDKGRGEPSPLLRQPAMTDVSDPGAPPAGGAPVIAGGWPPTW